MTDETTKYLNLLEERISLLNSLSEALAAARSAMVSFDMDALESQIAAQGNLCGKIQTLDEQAETLQFQCAAHLRLRQVDPCGDWDPKLQDALQRLHEAQAAVKHQNTAHQSLLIRSKRTVTALLNSLHTFEGTYQKAAVLQNSSKAEHREQV
jgi:hypothetical protein